MERCMNFVNHEFLTGMFIGNSRTFDNLNGKVKSFTEYRIFDVWITKIESIKPKSNEYIYSKKIYDEKGNLTEEVRESNMSIGKVKDTYTYDKTGNIIKMSTVSEEHLEQVGASKYEYDDNRNLIKETRYAFDCDYPNVEDYENFYDDKGFLIERIKKSSGGKPSKIIYTYDDKGNLIERKQFALSGENWNMSYTCKYDNNGNLIEENYNQSRGELYENRTYKIDNKGNKVEVNHYKPDGSIKSSYKYKNYYDHKGNWIRRICSMREGRVHIYEREYEYY